MGRDEDEDTERHALVSIYGHGRPKAFVVAAHLTSKALKRLHKEDSCGGMEWRPRSPDLEKSCRETLPNAMLFAPSLGFTSIV